MIDSILGGDMLATATLSLLSLMAVWVPFSRGLRLCLQARSATQRLSKQELRDMVQKGSGDVGEPLAALMARVLLNSLRETKAETYPRDYVVDAAKQHVVGEYDAHYAQPIGMYANLLPPIGFIGTTGGLLVLFLSRHLADQSMELGAVAVALTSSIFALIGYAILEGMKIRLYGRLMMGVGDVLAIQRSRNEAAAH
jgi:hypothetical protein